MKQVIEESSLLFYKIFNKLVTAKDYLDWSYRLIEAGLESISLYKLSSMKEDESIFLFDEYLSKTLSELDILIPTIEEAAHTYIRFLCKEIIKNNQNNFDLVKQICKISYTLDYPIELSVWLRLDDQIDSFIYDDDFYKPDETELLETIIHEAKHYIMKYENVGCNGNRN